MFYTEYTEITSQLGFIFIENVRWDSLKKFLVLWKDLNETEEIQQLNPESKKNPGICQVTRSTTYKMGKVQLINEGRAAPLEICLKHRFEIINY